MQHSTTPMALYKGLYPRSRQADSLSSAGAQQGAGLARLADCAHWGLVEWGGAEVNRSHSESKTKNSIKQSMGRQNQCCFCISYLFLLTLSELLSEDKLKL